MKKTEKILNQNKQEDNKYSQLYKKGYGSSAITLMINNLSTLNINLDGNSVLDCGCGHSPILNYYNLKEYVGIDVSSYQIEQLKKKYKHQYYHGSITDLSLFNDDKFDYVWCTDVLEHIVESDIEQTISEIKRVGKNAIISVCTRSSLIRDDLHLTVKPIDWWDIKIGKYKHKINLKKDTWLYVI